MSLDMSAEGYRNLLIKYPDLTEEDLKRLHSDLNLPVFHSYYWRCLEGLVELLIEQKIRGLDHIRAGPLVEICSVHIHKKKPVDTPSQVYGEIFGHVGKLLSYEIYNRSRSDPEVVKSGVGLTLVAPSPVYSEFHRFTALELILRDKAQMDAVIAKGFFSLVDDDQCDHCERAKTKEILGKIGSATVTYITMPYAIMASVLIDIKRKKTTDNQQIHYLNIKGHIYARCDPSFGIYDISPEQTFSTLFRKENDKFERVEIEKSLGLSKCWVAVPAYSSLILSLDLSEYGSDYLIIKNTVEFPANDFLDSSRTLTGNGFDIEVRVSWQFPIPSKGILEQQSNTKQQTKHLMSLRRAFSSIFHKTPPSLESISSPSAPSIVDNKKSLLGAPLTEIFSIFIGCKHQETLTLYGTIQLTSNTRTSYLFNRDMDNAATLPTDRFIPIEDPSILLYHNPLEVKVDIKDVEGLLSIKGNMRWVETNIDSGISGISWYNRRLCSIFRGNFGYAAMHYTLFSYAVQVIVNVTLRPKHSGCRIHGTIMVEYDDHDYSTRYQRDNYRSVLFRRIESDALPVVSELHLELSKSVITVPLSSRLVFKVNLSTGVDGEGINFDSIVECGKPFDLMESSYCDIHIGLEWGNNND